MRYLFVFLCFVFLTKLWADPCQEATTARRVVKKDFLPFEEAGKKARQVGILSKVQYQEWQKDHPDMPSNPNQTYADHWKGWGDFLGTGRGRKKDFRSFEEARAKAHLFKISSQRQYKAWQKDHSDMPSSPDQVYRDQWEGWGDFLGIYY